MKLFLALISFLILLPAYAGNAVFLSSFQISRPVQIYLDMKFKSAFSKTGLKVVIHHKVTPEILQQAITDPESEILIWMSHAGGEHPSENGLATKGVILDLYGNDVKNFFTSPNKNLKFLGIIGCSAKTIIEGFVARGNYDNRPDLEIKSYSEKVMLYAGFHETLKESLTHLGKDTSRNFEHENYVEINVSLIPKDGASIANSWVEVGDKVLTLITDKSKQYQRLKISQNDWDQTKTKNIKFNRLKNSNPDQGLLPKLEFFSDSGSWKLFTTKDGTIIGGNNKHLYIYKNEPSSVNPIIGNILF
jgi:hypothetical protein